MALVTKYNSRWPDDMSALEIELKCIAWGGKWKGKEGNECGAGLFEHFMAARKLLWPHRYRHRWTELMYQNFIENDLTVLMGCASSQKTSHAVEYCLINYLARPDNTLVVLSTVNMEKLEIGVWGECKMLWSEARRRYDWLPGNMIDHKKAISTDNLEDDGVRDMRKGIIGRPCYVGGKWVGLGILAGLKQDYIFYVADELQFMQEAFSLSWPHLFSNGNVKIIGSGNPKHDPDDELGQTGEPKEGWLAHPEPEKTEIWLTKFMGGKCVNLVGTDSPNFDSPEGSPEPFPRLIGRKFANRIAHDHGSGSFEFYRLVKGVMKVAFAHDRVITRQLCRDNRAMEQAQWKDDKQINIYALDPSYGGEDRCVGMPLKFGKDVDDNDVLMVFPYRVYRIDLTKEISVEDQIADIFAEELDLYDVEPENAFYDSTGKGTVGAAFARKFKHRVPVAVDSGARPSKRPVREDLFVEEKGVKRLKRCDEHYSKFVSEMWFSVRMAILCQQMRGMLPDVIAEGCARIYEMASGNKVEVESKNPSDPKKKDTLKRRLGKSPDLFDCLVIGLEGARQRGFKIRRLGSSKDSDNDAFQWLNDRVRKHDELIKSKQLQYASA